MIRACLVALLALVLLSSSDAWAQQKKRTRPFEGSTMPSTSQPVLLEADSVTYDQDTGVVSAIGNVELSQGDRIVNADRINYNEKDGIVTAIGNVVLLEPGGDVVFANRVELRDEWQNGTVDQMKMRLSDNSRMVAAQGTRVDANDTYLDQVAYTACNTCRADPSRPPLWAVKAKRAHHDQEEQKVTYTDAVIEAFGIPVAYTPYFSHYDPTVKAASGLLAPDIGTETYFGLKYRQPYYYRIDDTKDATITPFLSTRRGLQLAGEYRQRVDAGEFWVDGSGTYVDQYNSQNVATGDKVFRGHIRGAGRFIYDDQTDYGFNFFRSTDKTYTQLYHISNLNTLTSHGFLKTMDDRTYGAVDLYSFQTLRPNYDQGLEPIVLPLVNYNYVGEPNKYGAYFGYDFNTLSLFRTAGTTTQRVSMGGYWRLPYYAKSGEVYTLQARLRADGYWANQQVGGGTPTTQASYGFAGRVEPLVSFDWRYPWVRPGENHQLLVEPIAQALITPWGGNPYQIPNEDSQSYELDETNVFSISRFPGLDRYDGGPRVNYGVRTGLYLNNGTYSELLLGQSLRAGYNSAFVPGSGLYDPLSDLVGRFTFSPVPWLNIVDRARFHTQSGTLERNEVALSVGKSAANMGLTYAKLNKNLFTVLNTDQEALGFTANARFLQNWSVNMIYLTDLTGGGMLRTMVGLRYTDECLDLLVYFNRSNVVDADVQPSTSFGIRYVLANLG